MPIRTQQFDSASKHIHSHVCSPQQLQEALSLDLVRDIFLTFFLLRARGEKSLFHLDMLFADAEITEFSLFERSGEKLNESLPFIFIFSSHTLYR